MFDNFTSMEHSLAVFQRQFWPRLTQTGAYFGIVSSGICVKSMIVHYILFHTPKDRPLNRLLLANQVNKSTQIHI